MSLVKKQNLNLSSFLAILLFLICSVSFSEETKTFFGKAEVIDGDTIRINEKKIRLFGIDAPEKKQFCKKDYLNIFIFSFKKNYPCGQISSEKLKKFLNNQIISCKVKNEKDRYKRYLGICYKRNRDINAWLVKNGYAVLYRKYSKKYLNEEVYAKENKLGIWKGPFQMPWVWRKKNK